MSQTILKVEGMTCNHCKMRAEKALLGVSGVESVKVDLMAKEAVVMGEA
ncbi:MAG TPA: cation transporter, partial [Desulfosporosinus sp.]|nr:cation transporter [Desulfosporosinus sp.]